VGRPPKSNELHELQGTKSQASASAETMVGGRPKMPSGLSELEKEKWREMVRVLATRGTLTKGDGPALELYVATWSRWKKCLKEIDDHGVLVTVDYCGADGQACSKRVPNPATKIAGQLEVSLRQILKELGSTPASRQKAKQTKPAPPPKRKLEPGEDPDPILL
jgi:P27 family predicted phage terminase small subunit